MVMETISIPVNLNMVQALETYMVAQIQMMMDTVILAMISLTMHLLIQTAIAMGLRIQ